MPSTGDYVWVGVTSQGEGTGQLIECEVLHVHAVRKTGKVRLQLRTVHPVDLGDNRSVGRIQYVDSKWLREKPQPVTTVDLKGDNEYVQSKCQPPGAPKPRRKRELHSDLAVAAAPITTKKGR